MEEKRILLYFQSGDEFGLGHRYRCLEIINTAINMGINIIGVSNDKSATRQQFKLNANVTYKLRAGWFKAFLNRMKVKENDIIIFDLPVEPKEFMIDLTKERGMKLANLNATYDSDTPWADFNWYQDSPDTIILRKEVFSTRHNPIKNKWFVFGGSYDNMDMLNKFESAIQRDPAILIGTEFTKEPKLKFTNCHTFVECEGSTIFQHMASCEKACVAMGMTAWELAAIGVKPYIFSPTEKHLYYAKRMESLGLGLAYPEIGVPEGEQLRKFFVQQFEINTDNIPKPNNAERFINELLRACNELE